MLNAGLIGRPWQTIDVKAWSDEVSKGPNVNITRPPCPQPYSQIEFEVVDPKGYVLEPKHNPRAGKNIVQTLRCYLEAD